MTRRMEWPPPPLNLSPAPALHLLGRNFVHSRRWLGVRQASVRTLQWQPGGGILQRLAITTIFVWIAIMGYRLASHQPRGDGETDHYASSR